jgi:hypothetical protein
VSAFRRTGGEVRLKPDATYVRSDRLCLSIAGLGAVIESREPDLAIQAQGAVRQFVAENVAPDLIVRTHWATGNGAQCNSAPVFDSGAVWRLHRSGHDFVFQLTSPAIGPLPYKTAHVNDTFTSSVVGLYRPYFNGTTTLYPLAYPLDELLFVHLLAQGRGVELHACAAVDVSGEASLFIGQSGAGKSTMARLWAGEPGVTILSDDRIVVRPIDGRMLAYGTPWHGDEPFASAGPAPLARICFLRHGSSQRLKETGAAETAARLFACSFVPVYDASAIEFTLALLERIARHVPCYELEFAPNQSVIDFIRRSAGGAS